MATRRSTQQTEVSVAYGTRVRYSASLIQQGSKQFYSVTMPTDVLANCCFVTSRNEDPQSGFQRVLDKKRAQDIADYVDSGKGTIPGSIILSAQPDSKLSVVGRGKTLEFTFTPKAFLVLDGQHRVYGFSLANTALRVPVVIYRRVSSGLSRLSCGQRLGIDAPQMCCDDRVALGIERDDSDVRPVACLA